MQTHILIVGCGSIGERHLRCFQKTGRAEVTACDTRAALVEKMQGEYGVAGFNRLEAALAARKFDGAVICTPAHTHLDVARLLLERGVPLLIEKPLSTGLGQIPQLKEVVGRTGLFVAVAYVYHSMPWLSAARAHLQQGSLGKPLQVTVTAGQHFPTYRPAYREIYYARHETGGGAIQDALTHVVNAVEWLVGPTTRVHCEAAHQALEGVTVEDTVCVTARNGNVLTSYALNQFQAPNEMTLTVHCEQGSLKIDVHEQRWAVWPRGASAWECQTGKRLERDELFVAQAEAFLDGLQGRPTSLCTLDEAIQTLKFNLAALASAQSGQPVLIP